MLKFSSSTSGCAVKSEICNEKCKYYHVSNNVFLRYKTINIVGIIWQTVYLKYNFRILREIHSFPKCFTRYSHFSCSGELLKNLSHNHKCPARHVLIKSMCSQETETVCLTFTPKRGRRQNKERCQVNIV